MAKKTQTDPTGQRDNRARTTRKLDARLEQARRGVIKLFRDVPSSRRVVRKITNADTLPVYDYDLTPEQLEILQARIRQIIDMLLLETQGDTMPMNWWYKPEVEQPVRQGTLEELINFNQLIAIAAAEGVTGAGGVIPQRVAPEVILSSQSYIEALRSVYVDNFQTIKSLSSGTASQVIRVINNGIQSGLTPTKIAGNITERFDVSKSNAKRIADTEINKAYNDARLNATKTASDITGLRSAVRHLSALLPGRTRKTHAARHFLTYTPEQQREWWNTGSNRINCKCTIRSVIVKKEGDYIESAPSSENWSMREFA